MNPWLERALVSVAASVVSTTVWVTTAKQPAKKKKRRKKKKGDARGTDGVKVEEHVPRSPGAQAAHDYRSGHDGGLTGAELLENVKGLGKSTANKARFVGGLLGLGGGQKVPEPKKGKKKASSKKGAKKAAGSDKPQKRPPAPEDDLEALRDEAVKRAKKAAADRVVQEAAERAGMAATLEKLKDASEGIKQRGAELGKVVKEKMPENVGETLEGAGRSVKDAAERASRSVKEALDGEEGTGLGKKLDRGVRDLGRWIQGPGAPDDEERPRRERVEGAEVVEAKDAPADAGDKPEGAPADDEDSDAPSP